MKFAIVSRCCFSGVLAASALAAAAVPPSLSDWSADAGFAFLDWKGKTAVSDGVLEVKAKTGKGGLGANLTGDYSDHVDWSPAIRVRGGSGNQMKGLTLGVVDADGSRWMYQFDLSRLQAGVVAELTADSAASMALPNKVDKAGKAEGLDLKNLRSFQVLGDWRGDAVDLGIERVFLKPVDEVMLAARAELVEKLKREDQRRRKAEAERERVVREALAGMEHPADGPVVEGVCAVAPDLLAVTIQACEFVPRGQEEYLPREGDEIAGSGLEVPVWKDGRIVVEQVNLEVKRRQGKRLETLGSLAREAGMMHPGDKISGQSLLLATAGLPAAYRLSSADDPNYADALEPLAVHRKTKPNGKGQAGTERTPTLHRIYLKLPKSLVTGKNYRISFKALNTREAAVEYRHEPRKVRSEAVHASHVGYRPDDPFKRAYLSLWLGSGGGHAYPDGPGFELLDEATGERVFSGVAEEVLAIDGVESLQGNKNHAKTAVRALDFSKFRRPGRYRVHVAGIGCSDVFPIAESAWTDAFKVSMRGFLHHRASIELGPPLTDFVRPRNFHPDDMEILQTDVTLLDGESGAIRESIGRIGDGGGKVKEGWGGYHDAGDWDRRSQHLSCTMLQLELLEMFPEFFAGLKLRLPVKEAGNDLPDLLDEALWNLEFYHRLQQADGGVRGGIESTEHPRKGETSWQESLVVGVFAADPLSTLRFAATAAKAARVLQEHDAERAEGMLRDARRAWDWAEAKHGEFASRLRKSTDKKAARAIAEIGKQRNLAAAELLFTTGESKFDAAFKESTVLPGGGHDWPEQRDAIFTYARLPEGAGDAALKEKARAAVIGLAEISLQFAAGSAFGLTTDVPNLPAIGYVGYYSVPGMISQATPRAHHLTGDPRYLAGAVRACNFGAGANPDNMALTTGLGPNPVAFPLHIDSIMSGQAAPAGITVYGASDFSLDQGALGWAHTWFMNKCMYPPSRTWPPYESYCDIYQVPAMNEYTVHQTFARTGYYWGYLAARRAVGSE